MGKRKPDGEVAKPKRITTFKRKDWRTLPVSDWNTLTFTVYFVDMNRELFGVEYVPMRNWRFEQGVIKRTLDMYGPEIVRQAFDVCFREYRPTREYPILTAGFAVSYRINAIIPRLLAERETQKKREETVREGPGIAELEAWL